MRVTITEDEFATAAFVALLRVHHSLKGERKDALFEKDTFKNLDVHMKGTVGEVACSKALGIPWPMHVNVFKGKPDLPPDIEVRLRTNHDHDLIIRDGDDADRRYVLVTGSPPDLEIRGWLLGSEGKDPKWLKSYGGYKPAYFIPQRYLHPMETMTIEKA